MVLGALPAIAFCHPSFLGLFGFHLIQLSNAFNFKMNFKILEKALT